MIRLSAEERQFFSDNGYVVASEYVELGELTQLRQSFENAPAGPGTRRGLEDPVVRAMAEGLLSNIAEQLLADHPIPIRAILFTKSQDTNWLVPWHQDVTLAAPARIDLPGAGTWTQKEGVWHVQPPVSILERMVALRVHVDACGAEDGPLQVVPRSHLSGRLDTDQVDTRAKDGVSLLADPGQIIAMHPLTLHASSKSTGTSLRRVLHVEYCAASAYPFATEAKQ